MLSDASIAKVSLVGAGMKTNPGVAATVFETLAANGINIEMISTSAIRISVVAGDQRDQAVTVLHPPSASTPPDRGRPRRGGRRVRRNGWELPGAGRRRSLR